MIPNSKYKNIFFWTIELLALSLLILIVSRFDFLMKPISVFISTVFVLCFETCFDTFKENYS